MHSITKTPFNQLVYNKKNHDEKTQKLFDTSLNVFTFKNK